MTNQQAFDIVWQVFVVEGAPRSRDSVTGRCAYGAPSTTGCAVGCLIKATKREAVHKWEVRRNLVCTSLEDLLCDFSMRSLGLDGVDIDLLERLQHAHDMSTEMKLELIEIAGEFNLVIPRTSTKQHKQ